MRPHEFITIVEKFRLDLLEIDANARFQTGVNITAPEISSALKSVTLLLDVVKIGGLKECFEQVTHEV